MTVKQNKALDLNKLREAQRNGRLLKKHLTYPLIAQKKYDGNYTVTKVENGMVSHYTSGGLSYIHTDNGDDCFRDAKDGYYIAERIGGAGKLGDRVKCNLRGPKDAQTSTNHTYKVFDYLTFEEYEKGKSVSTYMKRQSKLFNSGVLAKSIVVGIYIENEEELEEYAEAISELGYEGLILVEPGFMWQNTKSRKVHLTKYKKRRTADLKCIDYQEGIGKYEGMLGSLLLRDSQGREVWVGSGLSDMDRSINPNNFMGKVIEIEFEQIIDTYIQPTFITIRHDKDIGDID